LPAKTAAKRKSKALDARLIEAVSHPIRLEALRIFFYRVASPNEVAQELGENVSVVSHHVRVLKELDHIELVKTEQRRGAVEHFYRAVVPTHIDDAGWEKLSKSRRQQLSVLVLQAVFGEVVRAVTKETFDARVDRHLSWVPFSVDEQGWDELTKRMAGWLDEIEEVKAASAKRLAANGEKGQRVVTSLMSFETPPGFGFGDAGFNEDE
jgi:DNA-binding transcriptional ArsR family regulator